MKRFILLSTICLFAFLIRATAQLTPTQAHKQSLLLREQAKGPQVSKGYYSIGNNSEKLYRNKKAATTDDDKVTRRAARKGFYSVAENSEKLNTPMGTIETNKGRRELQKGYYSVGNNADKL